MSIIAALADGKRVIIGSNDGCTISDTSTINEGILPWIFFGEWVLGVTGPMIALTLLKRSLENSKEQFDTAVDVMIAIQSALSEFDFGKKEEGEPYWSYSISCILANRSGRIWDIDQSLCVCSIPTDRLWARGSGHQFAIGADTGLLNSGSSFTMEERMKISVQASILNDVYCPGSVFCRML